MEKTKPVAQVRLGTICASIWRNDTENGSFYNVSFQKLYKDDDGWKYSESFHRDDLLVVAKVADLAHSRIHELQEEARAEERIE